MSLSQSNAGNEGLIYFLILVDRPATMESMETQHNKQLFWVINRFIKQHRQQETGKNTDFMRFLRGGISGATQEKNLININLFMLFNQSHQVCQFSHLFEIF